MEYSMRVEVLGYLSTPRLMFSAHFANDPGDLGSIPGRVIPNTQKSYLMLNTQHYKVRIKGKEEQSREWSSALPYTMV